VGKALEHPSTDVVFEEGGANKVNTRSKSTISLMVLIFGSVDFNMFLCSTHSRSKFGISYMIFILGVWILLC